MVQVFKPLTKSKLHAKVSVGRAGHTGAWGECEMRGGKRGFTLIELLVVIAIIAILAAILFPVFTVARNAGKKAACVSNLREIDYAYRMYLADSGDRYPSNHFGANLFLVEPYLRSRRFKLADTSGALKMTRVVRYFPRTSPIPTTVTFARAFTPSAGGEQVNETSFAPRLRSAAPCGVISRRRSPEGL